MKKKYLRIASLIMTIAMCFAICSPAVASSSHETAINVTDTEAIRAALGDEVMKRMAEQERAVEAYQYFCSHYREDNGYGIIHVFPDNYAGEYILGDKLYLYYVNSCENLKEVFGGKYTDVVIFEEVKYSLNDLRELWKNIASSLSGEQVSCQISTKENRLIVFLDEDTLRVYEALSQKAKLLNDALCFKLREESSAPTTTPLRGGDALTDRTISICGISDGYDVIISCGHLSTYAKTPVGTNFKLRNSILTVATVTASVYGHNVRGDFSIARVNTDSYHTTNQAMTYNYVNCVGADLSVAAGQTLIKYGSCGGYAAIEVETSLGDVVYSDDNEVGPFWTIKDMVTATFITGTNIPGDSGGTILRYDSRYGNYYYCGVISGRSYIEVIDPETGDVIEEIVTKLFFTPYALFSNSVNI